MQWLHIQIDRAFRNLFRNVHIHLAHVRNPRHLEAGLGTGSI